MLSLLRLERKQTNVSNPFRIRTFLFLSYSFGIETINTFIHSVVPSKTIPDSRPKWAKCIPKRRKTPPDGAAYTYVAYISEYPPGCNLAHEVTGFLLWIGTYCISCVVSLVGYDDSCFAAIGHVKSMIRVIQPRPNICSHSVLFFIFD